MAERDEDPLNELFAVLRAQMFVATIAFHERLQSHLDDVDAMSEHTRVSVWGLFISTAVQASNLFAQLLGASRDEWDADALPERDDESSE